MKKTWFYIAITILFLVVTYFNLSLSRANQIESFLKETAPIVESSPQGILFTAALASNLEPLETFVIEEILIEELLLTATLKADFSLLAYRVVNTNNLVFYIDNLSFYLLETELNDTLRVSATLNFENPITYKSINTDTLNITLTPLFEKDNQLFAIEFPYIFNEGVMNLQSLSFTVFQDDIETPLGTVEIQLNQRVVDTLTSINQTTTTNQYTTQFEIFNGEEIIAMYEKTIRFPILNVIIEILAIILLYSLYRFIKYRYQK